MTFAVTHTFVSAKSDGADPTLVQPSAWNDTHTLSQLPGTILGAIAGGSGETVELPISVDASGNTVIEATGFFRPPVGTTGQRTVSPTPGDERYNSTTNTMEYWNGTQWVQITQSIPTSMFGYFGGLPASCPSGWIVADGGTIGGPASNATNRPNVDTQALFTLYFTDASDVALPLKTSGGVVIPRATYANAALAFAANTQLTVPNGVDAGMFGAGGTIEPLPNVAGGALTATLIEANLPPHTHTGPTFTGVGAFGGAALIFSGGSGGAPTGPGNGTSTPFSILSSYIAQTPIIKL